MTRLRFAAACLALLLPGSAHAQNSAGSENISGLTVNGKGEVLAKPDLVEVDVEISSASELTADAIVKYRDARKKVRDAFAALKLENVAVEERGLLLGQKGQMNNPYFGFQPPSRTKTEVQLTRKLVIKGSGLRKLEEEAVLQLVARLLDVAQDAGARVGAPPVMDYYSYRFGSGNPSGLVRFVVDDFEPLQEQAYAKAVADATTRAQRLARLGHVELGPILGIREVLIPGERPTPPTQFIMYGGGSPTEPEEPRKRLEVEKYQEIPVRVELLVRFDVKPGAAPVAATTGGPRP